MDDDATTSWVDPGATSNFVRRSWVQSQRLREQTLRVPLQVKMAVGQVLLVSMVESLSVSYGGGLIGALCLCPGRDGALVTLGHSGHALAATCWSESRDS